MHSRIVRPLVLLALVVGLAATPTAGVGAATEGRRAPGDLSGRVSKVFSPNGDGRKDRAAVRFDRPSSGKVTIRVRQGTPGTTTRIARLGWRKRGTHVWRWDGRGRGRAYVPDGSYSIDVALTTSGGTRITARRRAVTRVDTVFSGRVEARHDYALPEGRALPVYPRTTVVRDSVSLRTFVDEKVRWAALVIMDTFGRTVLRTDVSDVRDNNYYEPDYGIDHPGDVVWTARRHGRALPPGRYRALVRGRDSAGNVGSTKAYPPGSPARCWSGARRPGRCRRPTAGGRSVTSSPPPTGAGSPRSPAARWSRARCSPVA